MRYRSVLLASLAVLTAHVCHADGPPKHLFVLSGQSNMQGLRPQESFIPAVQAAFGEDKAIVVFDALGGQPIRRWYKGWESKPGEQQTKIGDLYDRLMKKVNDAIADQDIESVTFVWMQGERDAKEKNADVYAASLKGLIDQLRKDLEVERVNVVIGRLSDFDMNDAKYPHWTKIREIQVKLADSTPYTEWVNTDDLNDGLNRRGKKIENDLHYSGEGYKVLGQRFADAAIKLIGTE